MADPPGVSIGFNDNWNVAAPTWTRIDTLTGCRVREWTVDRGRPTEFDKTGPGTAVVRIVDRQGLFDPTNPSSPYATKIVPGRQANLSLLNPTTGTWHTRFRGFVESWLYILDQTRQYMELELQLVDAFAVLARRMLRPGVDGTLPRPAGVPAGNVYYGETAGTVGDRIMTVIDQAGWPARVADGGLAVPWNDPGLAGAVPDVFSGNTRVGPKVYAGTGTSTLDALWDAADAEFSGVAIVWVSAAGHIRFTGRQARFRPDVAQYGIVRRTVGDPSATAGDTSVVPLSALEWMNSGDNLFNSCTATPQGIGTGTSWRLIDPDVDNLDGQHVEDAASVAKYGLRALTFDNLQTVYGIATGNNSLAETKLVAQHYVQNYATAPAPRISRMVFKTKRPGLPNSGALWELLARCEINWLLTVMTDHPGAGGFNQEFYVEGLHYVVRPGPPEHAVVDLTLDVSPRAHYASNPFGADVNP